MPLQVDFVMHVPYSVILYNSTPAATVRSQRLVRTDPGESHGPRLHDVLSDPGESQSGVDSEVRAHIREDVVYHTHTHTVPIKGYSKF